MRSHETYAPRFYAPDKGSGMGGKFELPNTYYPLLHGDLEQKQVLGTHQDALPLQDFKARLSIVPGTEVLRNIEGLSEFVLYGIIADMVKDPRKVHSVGISAITGGGKSPTLAGILKAVDECAPEIQEKTGMKPRARAITLAHVFQQAYADGAISPETPWGEFGRYSAAYASRRVGDAINWARRETTSRKNEIDLIIFEGGPLIDPDPLNSKDLRVARKFDFMNSTMQELADDRHYRQIVLLANLTLHNRTLEDRREKIWAKKQTGHVLTIGRATQLDGWRSTHEMQISCGNPYYAEGLLRFLAENIVHYGPQVLTMDRKLTVEDLMQNPDLIERLHEKFTEAIAVDEWGMKRWDTAAYEGRLFIERNPIMEPDEERETNKKFIVNAQDYIDAHRFLLENVPPPYGFSRPFPPTPKSRIITQPRER